MELKIVLKGLELSRRKKKWVLGLAALGFSGFAAYKVYHFPSIANRRQRLFKLLGAFISIVEAVSHSAEAVGIMSEDMIGFLQSDSDQIPKSLRQISKIARSDEFSQSLIRVTNAMTIGVMRGYQSQANVDSKVNSGFMDYVMDRLFTQAGSGFASVVVGSFARNLVMAFYSDVEANTSSLTNWVDAVCNENCRELIGDCIQKFVSTAVAIYLDKTISINTYDQILSGLRNPKHEAQVRDAIVSVCNGAVETFVKTSHQVLTSSDSDKNTISPRAVMNGNFGLEVISNALKTGRNSFNSRKADGWVRKMSSALALPSNRRLVLDVTSRVTFETVKYFLNFLVERLFEGLKRSVNVVREAVIDGTAELVQYVAAKSSVVATICISLCLQILGGVWILEPVAY